MALALWRRAAAADPGGGRPGACRWLDCERRDGGDYRVQVVLRLSATLMFVAVQGPMGGVVERRLTVVRASALAGLLVLIAGFGGLLTFWVIEDRRVPGLPGLFDYLSATWGDGLALPIMTGALVFAICRLPSAQHERLIAGAAAVVGAGLGAATQVQWLRDDAPQLNWTLPRPHHFNAAGIYHGVFLTSMCGVTAVLWLLVVVRMARMSGDFPGRRAVVVGIAIALLAAVSFVVLLALDSLPVRSTGAGAATVVAASAGVTMLLVLLMWAALRARKLWSSS